MASNFICSSTSNNKRANIRNFLIGFLLIAIGSIACIVGLAVLENNPGMFRGD